MMSEEIYSLYNPKDSQNKRQEQVLEISKRLGISKHATIMGLIWRGVYVKEVRTKSGQPAISKEMLAIEIGDLLGVKFQNLHKAGKQDLIKLREVLNNVVERTTKEQ